MKLPFWATIFTIIGVMVLCALGSWQVQRLQWKTEILEHVDEAFTEIEGGQIQPFSLVADMVRNDFIVGGSVRGTYLHDKAILIQSRVYDRVPGYHVVTPFVVSSPEIPPVILVNRGWIPLEAERGDAFEMQYPEGEVEISGMLVAPPDAKYQPENDMARDMWYRIDIEQLRDFMKIKYLEPKILYIGDAVVEYFYPVPVMGALRSNIHNNHKQYAFFWFAMAFVLIGVYAARFVFVKKI
ncbi:MAG: SURF1 family protein [Alphaproteobacteria bacterium]